MKKGSMSSAKTQSKKSKAETKEVEAAIGVGKPRYGLTMGLDLGDRGSYYCVLDEEGNVLERGDVVTEKQPLTVLLTGWKPILVVIEVGTHSPWVSRLMESLGQEVIVANPRKVQLISQNSRKNDPHDAELLARLGRADRELLKPVKHRSREAHADLMLIRVRAHLVEQRTDVVNAVRGLAKSFGERLPDKDAGSMNVKVAEHLPAEIRPHIERLLRIVEQLSREIWKCDKSIERLSADRYGEETRRLQQVVGVGPVTALTYVLTIEDPKRFRRSRDVGCKLGLVPKSDQSGGSNPELSISKEGDVYLRQLLVQGAQYILSARGPDTDLKRWGLKIAKKGKKKAKRRAVVAVARKLAVLLHRLWVSGELYEPRRGKEAKTRAVA
jgi:transposase